MKACLPTTLRLTAFLYLPSVCLAQNDTLSVQIRGSVSITLIKIEPGTFTKGAPFSESGRRTHDAPPHEVTLTTSYWIGKYEVTQDQWQAVSGTKPWEGRSEVTDAPNRPVVYAPRSEILKWIDRLNQLKRTTAFRLPTEAEWEYAARAGTSTAYSFGNNTSQLDAHAWHRGNTVDVGIREAQEVGRKNPNPWELHDLHGNVKEVVADPQRIYDGRPQTDPVATSGTVPNYKSGGYTNRARDVRSASRFGFGGDLATSSDGFRLYMRFDPPEPETPRWKPRPIRCRRHRSSSIPSPAEAWEMAGWPRKRSLGPARMAWPSIRRIAFISSTETPAGFDA